MVEKIEEDGIEYTYTIRFFGFYVGAKAVFEEDSNRGFYLVENGDLFWSYDKDAIYQKVNGEAYNAVTDEYDHWYSNSITGGLATAADVENLRSKLQTAAKPKPIHDTSARWRNDPATQKQLDKIGTLGGETMGITTKGQASDLIDSLIPSCHYCGMPATGFGFFDERVCAECGG